MLGPDPDNQHVPAARRRAIHVQRVAALLELWRRLLDRLRRTWRLGCGDMAEPRTVVIDSRTCPAAPSCFARGVDGGRKLRDVKVSIAVEKYGLPLAIDAAPANVQDTRGIVPVLRQLA